MAITSKGFAGGPMTDDDFGAIAARGAWVESAAALAVTQPNTGTRTVSIAAGAAVAHGVRAVNDAAISQALTAPGSGGQWYLLALRRDWTSGVKTTTLQVLTGLSTGSTTAPTTPPSTLPATFQSNAGGANTGAVGQADQPLAWVWASSASTTLTLFDLRLVFVLRALVAASLAALQTLVLHSAAVAAIQALCLDGITYRWNGTAWKPWDSDWASYLPTFSGISPGSGGAAAITFLWRYSNGEIEVKWNLVLGTTNGFVNGDITFTLPASASQAHYYDDLEQVRFIKSGGTVAPAGHVGVNTSTAFVRPDVVSGSNVVEGVASASVPFTWAAGDACVGRMRYTPA